jgi:prepilin-type N-terminal cleavage/methylation domain-containing protein
MKSIVERLVTLHARGRRSNRQDTGRQSGVTLIELIVALAIIALISAVVVSAVYQLLAATQQSNDQQYAVSQLRQAEHWMSRDALMAQTLSVDASPTGFPVSMTWEEIAGGDRAVTYTLQAMPMGTLYSLRRNETVTAPDTTVTTGLLVVAENIDASGSSCTYDAATRTLTVTLTATVGGDTEIRTFDAMRRSEA